MSKTTKNLVDAMRAATEKKTSAYDTRGTVTRIEDGVAWVHIPGGVDETPVKLTINAKAGDTVQVRVGGGGAFLMGNASSPPTDDTRANEAAKTANDAMSSSHIAKKAAEEAVESAGIAAEAAAQAVSDAATAQSAAEAAQNSLKSVVQGATTVEKAVSVMQTALEAVVDYDPQTDTTKEYFWHDANGAHVLGTSGDYRNDIDSTGMKIVDTATEQAVAEFGTDGAVFRDEGVENFRVSQSGASATTTLYKTLKVTAYAGTWRSSFMRISGVSGTITAKMGNRTTTFHYGTNRAVTYTDGSVEVTIRYDGADKITLEVNNRSGDAAVTYTVEATYAASVDAPYYSVGTRTGSAGGFSAIIGEGLQAETDDQIAVGKFNDNQSTNIFEVGNGTDDSNRANAFSIDQSGNVSATGGITDGTGNVLSEKADTSDIPTKLTDLTVDILTNSKSNVSIPRTTYTNLGQVTLPANGKYLIIGEGGCGAASSGTYFSLSTYTVSGTPTVAWSGTQQAPTNGGGQCSIMAYYATGSASAVIGLRGYLYGNGSTSGGWGQIVAVRIA